MILLTILSLVFFSVVDAGHPDEVKDLPGLDFPLNYKHYSGYLNATDGKFLHYWFVESQRSPATDPVVLWMNGGPGCSSLDGFLSELGPLHVSADGKSLYNNTFAWNREANVIFLEAPAGVGFSYSLSQDYSTDDDTVSLDNLVALRHFFQKFPQFRKNEFYITGESYGGIYIPTLSVRVLNDSPINFKGFAIGNGYLDVQNLTNSIVFFAYYHGLVGPQLWSALEKYCCNGVAARQNCHFSNPPNDQCNDAVTEVSAVVQGSGLNVYNLYEDCSYTSEKSSRYSVDKRNLLRYFPKPTNSIQVHDDPPCIDSSALKNYLNQPTVRKALHIPDSVQDWDICSLDVEMGYKRLYNTMRPQIEQLIGSGKLRGLIYNGDVDMACNFLGDEWFSSQLNLKVLSNYSEWKYNNQVAGFVKYFKNLTFLTIKGSGHMVPQDKPGPAFKMISSFLNNEFL